MPDFIEIVSHNAFTWRDAIRACRINCDWLHREFSTRAGRVLDHALDPSGAPNPKLAPGSSIRPGSGIVAGLGRCIETGGVVLWKFEIFDAASSGAESFVGQPAPVLPLGLWVFERQLRVVDADFAASLRLPADAVGRLCMLGIGFVAAFDPITKRSANFGVEIFMDMTTPGAPPILKFNHLGDVGEPIKSRTAHIYARARFLTLPFVEVVPDMGARAERRRPERNGQARAPIRIVTLRRRDSGGGEHAVAGDESVSHEAARVWRHQWIVRGHWRRQWYASRSTHEAIWIDPFIKGPDDKPLMAPQRTIQQAVR